MGIRTKPEQFDPERRRNTKRAAELSGYRETSRLEELRSSRNREEQHSGTVVSEPASRSPSIDSVSEQLSACVVPEATLLLLSYAGVTDLWDEMRDALEESDPWADEDLEEETGVDPERDVIGSLTGEVSLR